MSVSKASGLKDMVLVLSRFEEKFVCAFCLSFHLSEIQQNDPLFFKQQVINIVLIFLAECLKILKLEDIFEVQ